MGGSLFLKVHPVKSQSPVTGVLGAFGLEQNAARTLLENLSVRRGIVVLRCSASMEVNRLPPLLSLLSNARPVPLISKSPLKDPIFSLFLFRF